MRWKTAGLALLLAARLEAQPADADLCERGTYYDFRRLEAALLLREAFLDGDVRPYGRIRDRAALEIELEKNGGASRLCAFKVTDLGPGCDNYWESPRMIPLNGLIMDVDGDLLSDDVNVIEEGNPWTDSSFGENNDVVERLYEIRYGQKDLPASNPLTGEPLDGPLPAAYFAIVTKVGGERKVSYVRAPEGDGCIVFAHKDIDGDGREDVLTLMLDNLDRDAFGNPGAPAMIEPAPGEQPVYVSVPAASFSVPLRKRYCGDGEGRFYERNCRKELPPHLRIKHPYD